MDEDAILKELLQLHVRYTFKPQSIDDLISNKKKGALESLMFLKEKQDATINGQTGAHGRNQRENTEPGAATPPSISLLSA